MSNAALPTSRADDAPVAPDAQLRATLPSTLRSTIPALDGVRGVAILAVLAHQLCIDGYPMHRAVKDLLLPFEAGWLGVQLFFVLSGFLITGVLLETRHAQNYWSSFFMRRSLRIFPLYYLLLVLTFLVVPRLVDLPAAMLAEHRDAAWYWLYASNWTALAHVKGVETLGHCWSLSVEEQFYLLWPLVVRAVDDRGLARLCVGVAVASLLLRVGIRLAGLNPEIAYEITPARADALGLGALAAVVVRRHDWLARLTPHLGRLMAASFALLAVTTVTGGWLSRINPITQTVGYTLLAVASALLIVQVTVNTARGGGRLVTVLSSPLLRRFGKHSYAIYVLHLPFHLFVVHTLIAPRFSAMSQAGFLGVQLAYMVVATFVLLLLGMVLYRVVEQPFLDLKRFFATRATPA
jgi:peptidoglycan/LPS O-acetylase OafA/YrhL